VADGPGEVHEPVVECPSSDIATEQQAEREIGRLARLQRRRNRLWMLRFWMEDQLDMLPVLCSNAVMISATASSS
jgi:hypothetical protein